MKLTGGQAFPQSVRHLDGSISDSSYGMTLRDWFAGKAVQGIWANAHALAQMPAGGEAAAIASVAYEMADAMLKERSK